MAADEGGHMSGPPKGSMVMRHADGTPMTRKEVIVMRRGAFTWLPVLCSNDLVHGSWWMVFGSLGCAVTAVIPLIQGYLTFYSQHDDLLPTTDFDVIWTLLIVSGIFFTLGSLAFVRAFEEPPKRALLYFYYHAQSDELLGAWLFLFGTLPSVPYALVFISQHPTFPFFGTLFGALLCVFGTVLFVLACYPKKDSHGVVHKEFLIHFCITYCGGARIWVVKHLATDWLAGTWFFLWANVLFTVGSLILMFAAFAIGTAEQIFIWTSGFFNSFLFMVGSAYFVSGSYPHAQQFFYDTNRGGRSASITGAPGSLVDSAATTGSSNSDGNKHMNKPKVSKMKSREKGKKSSNSSVNSSGIYVGIDSSIEDGVVNPLHDEDNHVDESDADDDAIAVVASSNSDTVIVVQKQQITPKKKKKNKVHDEVLLNMNIDDSDDDNVDDDDDDEDTSAPLHHHLSTILKSKSYK